MYFYPIEKFYLIFEENIDSFLTFMSRNFLVWTLQKQDWKLFQSRRLRNKWQMTSMASSTLNQKQQDLKTMASKNHGPMSLRSWRSA